MKKVLLSTTALVAAGLLVTSVAYAQDEEMAEEEMMEEEMAAEPVSVGLSGSYRVILGVTNDASSPNLYEYLEPVISGSATMDNGLTFGISGYIGASGAWGTYDRHVSIGGNFGDLKIGAIRSARGQMRISAPSAASSFGIDGPYYGTITSLGGIATGVDTNNSGANIANRDTKILYMSPAVGGIQVGASYAPDGSVAEQMAFAATFTQALGDASVSINVGYETGDAGGPSISDFNAGATISLGDIKVGGGMRDSRDAAGNQTMQTDIGASMAMGALTLSAGWGSKDATNMYAVGAAYPLGEGAQLDVQVDFGNNDAPEAPDESEWVQFMAGVAISF